tara:strand:+ start:1474 stop:1635 length:162 start_codon:yes stop_codon:yes gene_type:complete
MVPMAPKTKNYKSPYEKLKKILIQKTKKDTIDTIKQLVSAPTGPTGARRKQWN